LAQPAPLGRLDLAHRVRDSGHDCERDDGYANPSFTLACYGRDPRDEQTMIADVLARAAAAVGT